MDEVERIQEAMEQLVERRKQRRKEARAVSEIEEEEDRLLSNLLSRLAAMKASGGAAAPPPGKDDLAAELRKLRRQNTITHILLATMIIVTGTWQFSQASLILSIKNKFTNPFKSAAILIGRVLKGGGQSLTELHRLSLDSNSHPIEGSILPQLTVPELPVLNLQNSLPAEEWPGS